MSCLEIGLVFFSSVVNIFVNSSSVCGALDLIAREVSLNANNLPNGRSYLWNHTSTYLSKLLPSKIKLVTLALWTGLTDDGQAL